MGTLARCFCCVDVDAALAFRTPEGVVVKDRCLGGVRLLGLCLAAFYFLVKRVVLDEGYLVLEDVRGIVETSLEAPADGLQGSSALPYCLDGAGAAGQSRSLPCVTGPSAWLAAPSAGSSELFVATHVKDLRGSGTTAGQAFVQDPEAYDVGIAFTMEAPRSSSGVRQASYSSSSRSLPTRLLSSSGEELPGALRRVGRFDVVPLRALLRAAGLPDLDAPTRSRGAVLSLDLDCARERSGTLSSCSYSVRHVQQSEGVSFLTSVGGLQGGQPSVQERHGIKIFVRCFGKVGQFRWSALASTWLTSMAMFWLVGIMVDSSLSKVAAWRSSWQKEGDCLVSSPTAGEAPEAAAKVEPAASRAEHAESVLPTQPEVLQAAPTTWVAGEGTGGGDLEYGQLPEHLRFQDVSLMLRPLPDPRGKRCTGGGKLLEQEAELHHLRSHDWEGTAYQPGPDDDGAAQWHEPWGSRERSGSNRRGASGRHGELDRAAVAHAEPISPARSSGGSRHVVPHSPQSRVGCLLTQCYEATDPDALEQGGCPAEAQQEEPAPRTPRGLRGFALPRGRSLQRLGRRSRSLSQPARLHLPSLLCGWACANSTGSPPPPPCFRTAGGLGSPPH